MTSKIAKPRKPDNCPKRNLDFVLDDIKDQWEEDSLAIILDKYLILFFSGILLLWLQFNYGILKSSLEFIQKYFMSFIPDDTSVSVIVIFVALITTLLYWYRIFNLEYKPNLNYSFFVYFLVILYFSERWSGNWIFYYLWKSRIALVDISLLFLFGELLSWIFFLTRCSEAKVVSNKIFKLDDFSDNNDEYQRNGFANEIAEYISNSFGKRSLAVGISGSWGTGKTYLINQIFRSLKGKKDKQTLFIHFNPWRSATSDQIIEDFLKLLKHKLRKYDRSLDNKFQNYLKVLIDNSETNWLKNLSNFFSTHDKPTDQIYDEINGSLKLINKKLVVFIDDLDRLHNNEILEVFRLIRNTADFCNTCFVVAYDREYIQSTFSTGSGQLNNYLDKIFQTEFFLPSINQITIRAELINELRKRFDDEKVKTDISNAFVQFKSLIILPEIIQQKRDIVRFSNNFCFDFKTIQDDVELSDFILVGLLKYRFPGVYKIIFQQSNRNVLLDAIEEKGRRKLIIRKSGFDELKNINQHVFGVYNNLETKLIENLIKLIFRKERGYKVNSICYPENYYKYFTLLISTDDIKISEFWAVIESPYIEAKKTINEWATQKVNERFNLMFSNCLIGDFKNKAQIQNYIYGIKKASWGTVEGSTVRFHIALNEGGFFNEGFKNIFGNKSIEELDKLIVELLFPEGVMDVYNWEIIKKLYLDGVDGNNLYSKEKSKELVITRFNKEIESKNYNILFDTWKTIVSGSDYNRWDKEILALTTSFADLIISNEDIFIPIIVARARIKSNVPPLVQENDLHSYSSNEYQDIVLEVIEILTARGIDIAGEVGMPTLNERLAFFRNLIKDNDLSIREMRYFVEEIIPVKNMETFVDYEPRIMKSYPVAKEKFESFDIDLFKQLKEKFESIRG